MHEVDEILHLHTTVGDIDTTTNHPFYIIDRGWVAAGDLVEGDEVYLIDGSTAFVTGAELEKLDEPIKVYNLEVADFNTYFVGDNAVLVHNYNADKKRVSLNDDGTFNIDDWSDYPTPDNHPDGPFTLLEGDDYAQARAQANSKNNSLHCNNPQYAGKHIHEEVPVKFGGSPTDIANKLFLNPKDHYPYTSFWNSILREIKNLL